MKFPEETPEKGFYYHYKHDLVRGVDAYAYMKYWASEYILMFIEYVTKDGKTFPRFEKIIDVGIVRELEHAKEKLCGQNNILSR